MTLVGTGIYNQVLNQQVSMNVPVLFAGNHNTAWQGLDGTI